MEIAELDRELDRVLEEYDEPGQQALEAFARRVLAKLVTPAAVLAVGWHEGCHCHGRYQRKEFEVHALDELAQRLAGCEHVLSPDFPRRGCARDDLNDAYWKLPLSGAEQELLHERFEAHRRHQARTKEMKGTEAAMVKGLARAVAEANQARRELDAVAGELTPEALTRRQAHVQALSEVVDVIRRQTAEATAALKDHQATPP